VGAVREVLTHFLGEPHMKPSAPHIWRYRGGHELTFEGMEELGGGPDWSWVQFMDLPGQSLSRITPEMFKQSFEIKYNSMDNILGVLADRERWVDGHLVTYTGV
jgi:hypothetical protein